MKIKRKAKVINREFLRMKSEGLSIFKKYNPDNGDHYCFDITDQREARDFALFLFCTRLDTVPNSFYFDDTVACCSASIVEELQKEIFTIM